MNFPPLNAPLRPASFHQGPNYPQYLRQGLGPWNCCHELEHICMFCPDVRTTQEQGIVDLNDSGRPTLGPGGGNGGKIYGYRPQGRFLSMREYTREAARHGQQGGGVATTAAPQPPQPQHIARSQLFQRASAQVTWFCSGIARQLSEIDRCYSGRSTDKEGTEQGNEDHIMPLSNEDDEQEEGQGDSSAEKEEESKMEEERDAHLDEEEREKRSAVVRMQAGYSFMNKRRKSMDEVTTGDDKWACIEEEVLGVSTSASNQAMRTLMKEVAFIKQPAKADPIENTTPKTTKATKVPWKSAPAQDTGN